MTTVGELAAVLKMCDMLISNDSGPVHIASALGVPVISIFGRSQKGLGPLRWGPQEGKYLHKDIGCIICLAHDCKKKYACLNSITVDEVTAVAENFLAAVSPRKC